MATLRQIQDFMASQPIAMVGVSRNSKKFGYTAFKELREKGLNVVPVNPAAAEIFGTKAFPDVKSLPSEVKGVIIMTKKDQTLSVVREAREKGIKNIWIQQMSDSKESVKELEGSDINYITGECVLMHYKPTSIHKFHMVIRKFFGGFPR